MWHTHISSNDGMTTEGGYGLMPQRTKQGLKYKFISLFFYLSKIISLYRKLFWVEILSKGNQNLWPPNLKEPSRTRGELYEVYFWCRKDEKF